MARPRHELDVLGAFRVSRILTLEELCRRLQASRSTLLRRLSEHGYHSSYNQAGRFLTIDEVADFDVRGLWLWKAARFSKHGNLKETVEHFVKQSKQGMTHEELTAVLAVRTHNTLLALVEQNRIRRERLGASFVYLSPKASLRREQIRQRKSVLASPKILRPSHQQIIAVLLELIKDPAAQREQLVRRCHRSGVSLEREQLDAIFQKYDLDKKRAPS